MINIRDKEVGNKFHGKTDVTAGGTFANPAHKLTEKIEKVFNEMQVPWTEVTTLWEDGTYPTEENKIVKYNDTFYRSKRVEKVTLDFTKINPSTTSVNKNFNDIANWINTQYVILRPEECIYHSDADYEYHVFISDEVSTTNYSLTSNGILFTAGNAFRFFVKTEDRSSLFPEIGTYYMSIDKIDYTLKLDDTGTESKDMQVQADDSDNDSGWRRWRFYREEGKGVSDVFPIDTQHVYEGTPGSESPTEKSIYPADWTELKLVGDDSQWYLQKLDITFVNYEDEEEYQARTGEVPILYVPITLDDITVDDYEAPTEDDRKYVGRDFRDDLFHADEQEVIDEWTKITDINELVEGDYFIITRNSNTIMFDGSATEATVTTDYKATVVDNSVDEIEEIESGETYWDEWVKLSVHLSPFVSEGTTYWNIKRNSGNYYIGTNANKSLKYSEEPDVYKNGITITDGLVSIQSYNNTSLTNLILQFNSQQSQFKYYTSTQVQIDLYKHLETEDDYKWEEIIKRKELGKTAFTNNYNDLDNKPLVGDIIVNDYPDGLPFASLDYKYILGRYSDTLWTITTGNGWNFNPVGYANEKSSMSSEQLNEYFRLHLSGSSSHLGTDNFNTSGWFELIKNTGIRFGSNSNTGTLKINLFDKDNTAETAKSYKFKEVELTFYPQVKTSGLAEAGKVDIKIGYKDELDWTEDPTIYVEKSVEFEVDTEPIEKTVTLTSSNWCNYIEISTDGTVGRRVVLTRFLYNDLKYWVSSSEEYIIADRIQWKRLASDYISSLLPKIKNKTLYI